MRRKKFKIIASFLSFMTIFATIISSAPVNASAGVLCFADTYEGDGISYSAFSSATTSQGLNDRAYYSPAGLLNLSSKAAKEKYKDMKVYVGGIPFGVKFMTEGLLVVGFCDVKSNGEERNPAREAGIKIGDRIISVNSKKISSSDELINIADKSKGKIITIGYLRDGKEYSVEVRPLLSDNENKYKAGIFLRDSGAGIGTVTYIIPESYEFAGLGHGICEAETGSLIPIGRGSVVGVTINGVKKGLVGSPGEVKGYFTSGKVGTLLKNHDCGVFGIYAEAPDPALLPLMNIGTRSEIKEGRATIRSTLDGTTPKEYEISISEIRRDATGNKCFTVKVTDPSLIEKTGGIIQGMSGSPIIQNGKLVGAVTHVLINDPTTGYGIFIENMLNVAEMPIQRAA